MFGRTYYWHSELYSSDKANQVPANNSGIIVSTISADASTCVARLLADGTASSSCLFLCYAACQLVYRARPGQYTSSSFLLERRRENFDVLSVQPLRHNRTESFLISLRRATRHTDIVMLVKPSIFFRAHTCSASKMCGIPCRRDMYYMSKSPAA